MSTVLFKRHAARNVFAHGDIVARQAPDGPGEENGPVPTLPTAVTSPTTSPTNPPTGPPGGNPQGPKPGTTTSSTTSSTRVRPTTPTTPPPPPPTTTSSSTTSSTTSTSSSTASTTSSTTSSVLSTTSSGTSLTRPTTLLNTATPNFNAGLTRLTTSITDTISSAEPSSTEATEQSGAVNTGPIIGGVAGGIAAIAFIGFFVAFLIRRRRSRAREDEFDTSQFRRSAMMLDGDGSRPMTFFGTSRGGHHHTPSVGDAGQNMAGQGAFQEKADYNEKAMYQDNTGYAQEQYAGYNATNYGATAAAPAPALQPRQQFTYGQPYNDGSDHGHGQEYEPNGAYSTQPQVQGVYNLQAYGDYHAYQPDQQQYGQQYAGPHAVSQDATRQTGQPHVGPGRKSLNEDDAYGGI